MKSLIQTGSSGWVPAPPEKRFLVNHRRAAQARPDDWVSAGKLARILRESGDPAGALSQWQRVETLMPRYTQAVYQQDNVRYEQGRVREAMALFERVLALKADTSEAIVQFPEAVRLEPGNPEARFNLANAPAAQQDTDAAIAILDALARERPD